MALRSKQKRDSFSMTQNYYVNVLKTLENEAHLDILGRNGRCFLAVAKVTERTHDAAKIVYLKRNWDGHEYGVCGSEIREP